MAEHATTIELNQLHPACRGPNANGVRERTLGDEGMEKCREKASPRHAAQYTQAATIAQLANSWRVACALTTYRELQLDHALEAAGNLCPPRPLSYYAHLRALTEDEQNSIEQWEAQCKAIENGHGVRELDELFEAAAREKEELQRQIIEMPPTRLSEAALKYEVVLSSARDGDRIDNPQLIFGFLQDLQRMAAMDGMS